MRALVVALLIGAPLVAGDESSLQEAVELYRSPDAAKRTAGSRLAEREVRRLLAPLIEAMRDDDPEVRRRARRSILSLVPGEAEKEADPPTPEAVRAAVKAALKAQRNQQFQVRRRFREERKRKASRLLSALGIRGTKWLPRKTGFLIQEVRRGSPAARLGLQRGDVLVNVNGRAVTEGLDFPAALGDKPDWSRVTITRLRNGKYVRLPAPRD